MQVEEYKLTNTALQHVFRINELEVPINLVQLTKNYVIAFNNQDTPVSKSWLCYYLPKDLPLQDLFPKVLHQSKGENFVFIVAEEHKGAQMLFNWPKPTTIFGKTYHIIPVHPKEQPYP